MAGLFDNIPDTAPAQPKGLFDAIPDAAPSPAPQAAKGLFDDIPDAAPQNVSRETSGDWRQKNLWDLTGSDLAQAQSQSASTPAPSWGQIGQGILNRMGRIVDPGNVATSQVAAPAVQGMQESVRQGADTAKTLQGQVPEDRAQSPNAAPLAWSDVGTGQIIPKAAYRLGESAPSMVGGIAAGTAATALAGGPETPLGIGAGLGAGAMGAGAVSAAQSLGPSFRQELTKTPNDPDGAYNRALHQAEISGLFSGAGWALFGVAPFQSAVKNTLFQAFGVQPAVSVAQQATQNLASGQPVTEGLGQAYAEGAVGTAVPMLGHAAISHFAGGSPLAAKVEDVASQVASPTDAQNQQAAMVTRLHDTAAKVAQPISDAPNAPKAAYISDVYDAMKPRSTELLAAVGASVPRDHELDDLGFYSNALEAARNLKQAKGTPEQMRAQLKNAGVKDSEITATGLDRLLQGRGDRAGGPSSDNGPLTQITRDQIVNHLQDNRVGLTETKYGGKEPTGPDIYNPTVFHEPEYPDVVGPARFSGYSLDKGSNPTYRETTWSLPHSTDTPEAIKLRAKIKEMATFGGDLAANSDWMDARTRLGNIEASNFQSGHWPDPNVIAHARTSMQTTANGAKAFNVDELQSDWGQKIRDSGGARDEGKIAELQKAVSDGERGLVKMTDAAISNGGSGKLDVGAYLKAKADVDLRRSELRTEMSATPGHPLVNTSDQWQQTAMKRLVRQAVDAGADGITIPSGDTVLGYGMGGKSEGMKYAYDQMYPKQMAKILGKLDPDIKPQKTKIQGHEDRGEFTYFPLTDKAKAKVVGEGQPMFAITAYHGTPHDIPLEQGFRPDKIGTGEGGTDTWGGHGYWFSNTTKTPGKYTSPVRVGDESAFRDAKGHVFTVSLDTDKSHLLDVQKPVEDQPLPVRKALAKAGITSSKTSETWDAYKQLLDKFETHKALSEFMAKNGVDGSSMTNMGETHTVMFPGTEDKIKITHVDGTPVSAKEKAAYLAATGIGGSGPTKSDVEVRNSLAKTIADGNKHVTPTDTVNHLFDTLAPHMKIVPKWAHVGVTSRIEPYTKGDKPGVNAVLTHMDVTGRERTKYMNASFIARVRAFYDPDTKSVVINHFGALDPALTGDLDHRVPGELRHELVHALRDRGFGGANWGDLVAHANNLHILDTDLGSYLKMIRDPSADKTDKETLRDFYEGAYGHLDDFQERMDQEAVAHMVEAYHYGYLSPEDFGTSRDYFERAGLIEPRPEQSSAPSGPYDANYETRLGKLVDEALNEYRQKSGTGASSGESPQDRASRFLESLAGQGQYSPKGQREGQGNGSGNRGNAVARPPVGRQLRAEAYDLLGKYYSPEEVSKRAKAQGFTTPGWHATYADFDVPDPHRADFGFHFAIRRPNAANERINFDLSHQSRALMKQLDYGPGDDSTPKIIPLKVNAGLSLRVPDLGNWRSPDKWERAEKYLRSAGNTGLARWMRDWMARYNDVEFSPDAAQRFEVDRRASMQALADEFDRRGYGSIVYENEGEDVGHDSMFVWDPKRVRSALDPFHEESSGKPGITASQPFVERDIRAELNSWLMQHGRADEALFAVGGGPKIPKPTLPKAKPATGQDRDPQLEAFKQHLTNLAKSGDVKLIPAKIANGDTDALAKARRSAIVIDGKPVHRIVIPRGRTEASQSPAGASSVPLGGNGGGRGPRPPGGPPRGGSGGSDGFHPVDPIRSPSNVFAKALDRYLTGYKKTFQPELISDSALQADPLFAKYRGATAQEKDAIIHRLDAEDIWWGKQGWPKQFAFIKAYETGTLGKLGDPALTKMGSRYKRLLDKAYSDEKEYGSKADYVNNYMAHLWKQSPDQVRQVFDSAARPENLGPKWFQNARDIDLIEHGIKAGLELKTTNPARLVSLRLMAGADMRNRIQLLRDLQGMGLVTKAKGANIPNAHEWAAVNAPDKEQWLIAPDVQPLWKNAVESKGLWQNEGIPGNLFRAWMWYKTFTVPLKLAFSMFHPLHVLHINMTNNMVRGWNEAARGGDVLGGLKSFFSNPFRDKTGIEGRKAWLTPSEKQTPAQKDIVQAYTEGGFTPMMSQEMQIGARRNFRDAINNQQYFKAAPEAFRRAIEWMQSPIFEHWIPHLKAAAYLKEDAAMAARRPDIYADPVQRAVARRAIAKSVDNRFGEMNNGNVFWNRTLRDVSIGSFLSLGWNLGFAREFGGGLIEPVMNRMGKGTATRQTIQEATNKSAYVVAYTASAMAIAGAMTYAMTGQMPTGLDYIFPRTGGKNPDGSDRRYTTMFFTREVPMLMKHIQEKQSIGGGAAAMLYNKLMIQPTLEAIQNRDYYGNQLYDENAPINRQILQMTMKQLKDIASPITVSGAERALQTRGETVGDLFTGKASGAAYRDTAMAMLGFGPAPAYAAKSEAQNRIAYLYDQHFGGVKAYEQTEKDQVRRDAKTAYLVAKENGDAAGMAAAKAHALADGVSKQSLRNFDTRGDTFMYKRLPDEDQRSILDLTSGAEHDNYLKITRPRVRIEYQKNHPAPVTQQSSTSP